MTSPRSRRLRHPCVRRGGGSSRNWRPAPWSLVAGALAVGGFWGSSVFVYCVVLSRFVVIVVVVVVATVCFCFFAG